MQEMAKTMTLGEPFLQSPLLPSIPTTAPSQGQGRRYLRVSSPVGHVSRPRRMVSCSRPRKQQVSLRTEVILAGSPTPRLPPWAGPSHSRELRQLQGLAQAGGQSGHVLWLEVALTQPEGRGQRAELGRSLSGLQSCCPPVSPRAQGGAPTGCKGLDQDLRKGPRGNLCSGSFSLERPPPKKVLESSLTEP